MCFASAVGAKTKYAYWWSPRGGVAWRSPISTANAWSSLPTAVRSASPCDSTAQHVGRHAYAVVAAPALDRGRGPAPLLR